MESVNIKGENPT